MLGNFFDSSDNDVDVFRCGNFLIIFLMKIYVYFLENKIIIFLRKKYLNVFILRW